MPLPDAKVKVSLLHHADLIAQWVIDPGLTTSDGIRRHVPCHFEYGTYEIMNDEKPLGRFVFLSKPMGMLRLVRTAKRIDVKLRLVSGDEAMSWSNIPPHLLLADLGIPGAWGSFVVLKGDAIIDMDCRVWREGETEPVRLTMVKNSLSYTIFLMYVSVGDLDDRAYLFPGSGD